MISYIKLLLLIALASAEVNVTARKNCILDNVPVMKAFHTMKSCFSEIIQDQIGNSSASKPGCHRVQDFNTTFENFRFQAIDSCIPEEYRHIYKQRKEYLFDFFAFSLSGNKFTEFYTLQGKNCVIINKVKLIGCVEETIGSEHTFPVAKMDKDMPKYWLNLNRPKFSENVCDTAEAIKMCVEEIVTEKCTVGSAQFIIGLLNYMIGQCRNEYPKKIY